MTYPWPAAPVVRRCSRWAAAQELQPGQQRHLGQPGQHQAVLRHLEPLGPLEQHPEHLGQLGQHRLLEPLEQHRRQGPEERRLEPSEQHHRQGLEEHRLEPLEQRPGHLEEREDQEAGDRKEDHREEEAFRGQRGCQRKRRMPGSREGRPWAQTCPSCKGSPQRGR